MAYSLMLLADPGPARSEVLRVLEASEDTRRDPRVESRFWLSTPAGDLQINIGTKDPVESIHLEAEGDDLSRLEIAVRRALQLAALLDMRVEDVHWGYEVTEENLPQLREYWRSEEARPRAPLAPPRAERPWWRFW